MAVRHQFLLTLTVLSAAGMVGCAGGGPPAFEKPPVRVVCTTTIVADAVQRVGGDRVAGQTVMGRGIDPHRYQPTAGDSVKLESAHLVFFNGLHLEGKMADIFEQGAANNTLRAAAVTRAIPVGELRQAEEDGPEARDPHVWFDVTLWAKTIDVVRDELSALDPAGADQYRRNADAYRKELAALDAEVRAAIQTIPETKRVLVTSHDAFGYFGRAYGLEVHGLQGVSTASDPSPRDVESLARLLGTRRIPAVFGETSVPPKGLQKVMDVVASTYQFDVTLIGGDNALFSDALGEPGGPGGTYPGMVRHNVGVIVRALSK